MDSCSYQNQISAYHDGELSGTELAAMSQHLAVCEICRKELEQIQRLSAMFATAPKRLMPAGVRQRTYALSSQLRPLPYLRIAEWTTALAASILIAAAAWIFYGQAPAQPATAFADVTPVALNPPTLHDASEMPEDPKLIDWVTVNVAAGQNP